jgi:phage tail-like protein
VNEAELLDRLPWIIQQGGRAGEDTPLRALLGAMERMHAPDEAVLAAIDAYVDPRRTPDAFVEFLSVWVDMAWLFLDPPDDPYARPGPPFAGGTGRLRELIAAAAGASQWRGTARGLVGLLELATGVRGFTVDEELLDDDGRPRPYHIRGRAPAAPGPLADLILRIAEHEKPAHVTLEPRVLFEPETP